MELEKEYEEIIDDYKDFLNEFKRIVEKILVRKKIPTVFGIYGRYKKFDSINEKLLSERFKIKKTVTELNDLVGIRIVLLYPEFKDKVVEILTTEFELLNNPNRNNQSPDKFGYNSIHLILKIKEDWAKTPDWESHVNKKIEVQIRTLSEHIWAETSHSLFYKREENIPKVINRDLYKVSALLEVVDDKLQDLKDKVEEHFEYIKNASYEEILLLDLNSETFRRVMLENSKGLYKLDDPQNKLLSSRIEKNYNMLNVDVFNNIIADKIELSGLDQAGYIDEVIKLLEKDKLQFEKNKQELK
ncbi:RelA/SpoT domain-containing protein [Tenacibaculum aiptasiae]|uniref:RelA/SpoT domain-containing protein n=1 Tax=Tenacibaculum aiptasiae TaxID=426481 RepID=A0A7J5A901_9FLAO|nr:RelA/SpoT domain-containing protein [Tenacibaculum aiptasiae]KAB1153933.1 RelA/SpoT domain-containing protein [Tenacibaculum aiptasiae]